MRVGLAILALALVCTTAAFGQLVLGPNQRLLCLSGMIVTAPTAGAPSLVNATLRRFPTLAFRLCDDEHGEHYFLRVPERPSEGVCKYYEKEVFAPVDPRIAGESELGTTANVRWDEPPAP